VSNVAIDEMTEPGKNTIDVRATDARGVTGTGSFSIGAFEPPGWFEFMLGENPTVTRDDQQRWVLRSSEPTVPPDGLLGPKFNFQVPIENISGVFNLGIGANYGFEYVFADSQGTATGSGKLKLSTPIDGVTVDADIGGGKQKGSASQSFMFKLGGTVGIDENAERAQLEGARVEFGTKVSATRPVYGVGAPVPGSDKTVGVTVDVTLSKGFKPGVELAVNDARTALEPSRITLTETVGVQISAGAGGSIGRGGVTVGLEVRGYAAGKGTFTIEVHPDIEAAKAAVTLEAGVLGCLGPCIKKPLVKDTFQLLGDRTIQTIDTPPGDPPETEANAQRRSQRSS
jgi:hypothetical protein